MPMASMDDAERQPTAATNPPDLPHPAGVTEATGVTDGTNFVLFDFRALATFDERQPRVVTLAETGSLRLALVMLRAGQAFAPPPMASEASVQALRGRLRLSVASASGVAASAAEADGEASTELRAGRLAQVEAQMALRLQALSDAVALLSLAPSPGAALPNDAGPLVTRA